MSGEGFLARWSRRKRGVAEEEPRPGAQGEPVPPAEAPATAAPPSPGPAPEPAFDPASLPPLESLDAASDFRPFLRPEVPALLRQAALRRMWSLDPGIRDFVGPADYAWDFNAPDGVPGFGPELFGDVKRLLAQAIGAPLEPEEKEEEGVGKANPPLAIAMAEEGMLAEAPPAPLPAAGPDAMAPEPVLLPAPPDQLPDHSPAALPATGIGEAAAPGKGEREAPPLPRRRHGGALPA